MRPGLVEPRYDTIPMERGKLNQYPVSRKPCAHCGLPMVVIPGDHRDMYQCQNWRCPRDHQPQGYRRRNDD